MSKRRRKLDGEQAEEVRLAKAAYSRPRQRTPRIVTMHRGKEITDQDEAARLRAQAASQVEANAAAELIEPKDEIAPEADRVAAALRRVEGRMVEALWTLALLPDREARFFNPGRCGLDYVPDRSERFANAVAAGGDWEQGEPRPTLPTSRAIDAMYAPLSWLSRIPQRDARLLSIAAATKRGDPTRRVAWGRVRRMMPEYDLVDVRTLQRKYARAIRNILLSVS